ncbi:SMP-30/gluconolactonase/LRE family protein [Sinorhizobium mexicanum]|uniref:SMP-30/gluconolactonase/LRE family protein n=1 Tax=Sinorhizobium mexicanum TaxID=375549 RepID=A0A859QUA1_9HYPH|nr:SMP-30/gluconolactonase/LRE family protein [Sinorhizobium mexicanum]MBP1888098.1 sugar lactone lactonase YvrE [Sinorhizobium mexicanum]QLL65707.1 SMP-30/gluconolactonase/LRE family protein [Sinorhizobium mexicanum]
MAERHSFEPHQQNISAGGRTLGLDPICADFELERFAHVPGARLEGPVFDTEGNLWVVGLNTRKVYRIDGAGAATAVAETPGPNGLAIGPDGNIYGADHVMGLFRLDQSTGVVAWLAGKGGHGNFRGLNDLTFDASGGLYLTDPRGSGEFRRCGGLYYRAADGALTRLVDNMAYPNGVALSPAQDMLYVAETAANRVVQFKIKAPGTIDLEDGRVFAWLNGGRGPDGLTVDAGGNVYVAHHSAGEVLVFSSLGFYYGAILMPDDAMVANNVQIHRGYLYITEADGHSVWRIRTRIPAIGEDTKQNWPEYK